MKIALAILSLLAATQAFAGDGQFRWRSMVGVITAPNVDNPVADIHAGTLPWSVWRGEAEVDLASGSASFDVQGLVLNGSPFSGTPGPVTAVTGTLVCDAGTAAEAVFDTDPVALDAKGDGRFSGSFGAIPSSCGNPLFLIRIASPAGAAGRWIATGSQRSTH